MNHFSPSSMSRRRLLLAAAASGAAPLVACATAPSLDATPPIVFVHGNGDTASIWMTTIWRFESNGWPRERLHAIDMPYPNARADDAKTQPGSSSTAEQMAYLAAEVKKVLAATGASKVDLVGISRGGYPIRNFVANGGGAGLVSSIVLCGVPNHGVWAHNNFLPGSEFNGVGPFLSGLNAPRGPDGNEVVPRIRWMTIRSDNFDRYAQPSQGGAATHVGFDGPALKGAENVVIAGLDHRETAFSPKAFAEMYRFLAGKPAATTGVVAESTVVLDGIVSGLGLGNAQGTYVTNLPLVGATLGVFTTNPDTGERMGNAKYQKTIAGDGHWGPFRADGTADYEFVVAANGYAVTHIYRSPFLRSSDIVNMHPERLADADRDATSLVLFNRMRGYFAPARDHIVLDGVSPPAGIPGGPPTVSLTRLKVAGGGSRPIVGEFNGERIVGRTWPAADNQVVVLDLTS
ncbi:MAG: alpha/beta fold hydrolase [Caldimonas sp.]|nr:alpha/beta fold hydrolase [Pseudomonadota bacterium]